MNKHTLLQQKPLNLCFFLSAIDDNKKHKVNINFLEADISWNVVMKYTLTHYLSNGLEFIKVLIRIFLLSFIRI